MSFTGEHHHGVHDPSAIELVERIIRTLAEVKTTDGIPKSTAARCDHYTRTLHDNLHDLALWLDELQHWAPLSPEKRQHLSELSHMLAATEAPFHSMLDID